MDAQNSAAMAVTLFFLFWTGWFLLSALSAEQRSRRLANFALACGFFAMGRSPEHLFSAEGALKEALRIGAPMMMALIALVGVVLAVLALKVRGADGGTGVARPVIGLLLCVMMGMSKAFIALMSLTLSPATTQPWEWTSQRYDYRLRLPQECVEGKREGMDGAFHCGLKRMNAVVAVRQADAADYAAAVQKLRAKMSGSDLHQGAPITESTSTEAGWPCTRVTIVEKAREGQPPVLVSIALIHWPEHGLLFDVLLEGQIWPSSEEGKTMMHEYFTRSARELHLSFRPANTGQES